MIVFNCPACEKHFKLSDRFAGRQLFCSGCKTELTVPEPEEELGLAPMPESEPSVPPLAPLSPPASAAVSPPAADIYAIPQAVAENVRCFGSNIEFECSGCGRHFTLTRRFAGRIMLCSGCKSELHVPEYAEEEFETIPAFPVPPPPPMVGIPVPPPMPPIPVSPGGFTSSSGVDGFESAPPPVDDDTHRYENAVATRTGEDSAILAYVYQEKHGVGDTPEPADSPGPIPMPQADAPRRRNLVFWLCTLATFGAIVGLCVYLATLLERSEPDRRPAMLEQISRQKNRAATESGAKETESKLERFMAMESWNNAGELIDNYIVAMEKKIPKQENRAIDDRLADFSKQITGALEKAVGHESASNAADRDSAILGVEARFYTEEERKLTDRIRSVPDERTDPVFPTFEARRTATIGDSVIRFDTDWTEGDFSRFAFPGMFPERYFASFDGVRRFFGEKSLRITALEKEPITVSFPGAGSNSRQNGKNSRCFGFSMRFPEIGDRLMIGNDPEAGKLGEIRVRFVNSSGYVDFVATSPRYCEALYYDARGRFVTVEFPLSGDSFWRRSDHFDLAKLDRSDDSIESLLSGETDPPAVEPPPDLKVAGTEEDADEGVDEERPEPATVSFFSQIDRVELRFVPLSAPTTLWLDGLTVSNKEDVTPYDLLRAESLQSEDRRKERELFQRRADATPTTENKPEGVPVAEMTEPAPADGDGDKPDTERAPLEFAGADELRLRKLLIWILHDAKGRIQVRVQGRPQSLGSKSSLPDSFDDFTVEEIDLSRAKNVTNERLDQIGELKTLKKLNLSYTELKDDSLIRLATLTELESLNLGYNDLTFAALPGIQTLKNLRELNLDGIRMSVNGIDALGNMTGLRSLSLSRSHADSNDLIYWITLTELESLDLSGSKIGDRGLANLRAFTSLTSLDLSKTRISDTGVRNLDVLRNLRKLNLDDTGLTNTCLISFSKLANLESVSVIKTRISRDGVRRALGPAWVGRFTFE